MHLALDVHGVHLPVVVLGDDLHYILLLKGVFIHPLHGTHALHGDGGAHLQRFPGLREIKVVHGLITEQISGTASDAEIVCTH